VRVPIDSSSFCADLELIQTFEKQSIPITCDEDRVLFRQGEAPAGIFILREGAATLSRHCSENEFVISLRSTAPSLIGLPGVLSRNPHAFSAVAQSGSHVSFVNRDEVAHFMETDPPLSIRVLQVLAAEVDYARKAILNRIRGDDLLASS